MKVRSISGLYRHDFMMLRMSYLTGLVKTLVRMANAKAFRLALEERPKFLTWLVLSRSIS